MPIELDYWLLAVHTPIEPRRFLLWLEHFKTMQAVFQASAAFWRQEGLCDSHIKALTEPNWREVENTRRWLSMPDTNAITLLDQDYPPLLKQISNPPLVLFVKGAVEILSLPQVGIVGSRRVSPYGTKHASTFARDLARAGLVVTSGLAAGVDAIAHRSTLDANGLTIAVMGTGLGAIYPYKNTRLAAEILEKGGALISEFPLASGPNAYHFPRRNRIISGLSKGVLVIEAAIKSGSLITARHAAEQGREVFALPGPVQSSLSHGCHALIRQGAKLVETVTDILDELNMVYHRIAVEFSPPLAIMPKTPSVSEQKIYEHIGATATSLDEIILRSGLTASEVSSILLVLELQGHIQSVTGGYVR
jgi:DNA processing protein